MQRGKNHPAKRRHQRIAAACVLAFCALTPACKSPKTAAPAAAATPADSKLAAARIDLAKSRPADEALALLVSALEADPQSAETRALIADTLTKTRWHVPEITLDHRQPIEHIHFAAPSLLWVSLSGEANTTVRWNLESLKIEGTLFPIKGAQTRSLTIDRTLSSMVVERAGVTQLCNARTLKPIRDIGPLPEIFSPSAVIVFSADGLLLAHPAFASKDDPSTVWHLRDAKSGGIIRTSEPAGPQQPRALAAFLDRRGLRVLQADGSLFEMPLSPAEAVRTTPPQEPVSLLDAQFAQNGGSALVSKNPGPHLAPELCIMSFSEDEDVSLEPASLLERFPWSKHPGIWTGLLRDPELARIKVEAPHRIDCD